MLCNPRFSLAIAAILLAPVACSENDGGGPGGTGTGAGTNSGTSTGTETGSTGGSGGTGGTGGTGATAGAGGGSGGTGGSVATGPSCASLPDNCGPNANENCCTSLVVPGGTYHRSYNGIDLVDNSNPATVSTFALDRFEVTVGRFRAFVAAAQGTQANPPSPGDGSHPIIGSPSGWDSVWNTELEGDTSALRIALNGCDAAYITWTATPGANETLPITCVTWFEAFAFCSWDGGWLPTEAEWDYAAAGGSEQRYYPWSAAYPPGSTTVDSTYAVYDCMADGVGSCASTDILTVGSRSPKGDGRWGQADLGGNMFEWGLDWFHLSYANPCTDCANLTALSSRVLRGGYFRFDAAYLRAGNRDAFAPDFRTAGTGLRCARNP